MRSASLAGGVIGGRTAAAHQRGFEVAVHDRAASLAEAVFGLQLGPYAVEVARSIRIFDELKLFEIEPSAGVSLKWGRGMNERTYGNEEAESCPARWREKLPLPALWEVESRP